MAGWAAAVVGLLFGEDADLGSASAGCVRVARYTCRYPAVREIGPTLGPGHSLLLLGLCDGKVLFCTGKRRASFLLLALRAEPLINK